MYAVIPVTIDFVNLQYTGKSTLLQMWGHFILSNTVKYLGNDYNRILQKSNRKISKPAAELSTTCFLHINCSTQSHL